MIMKLIKLKQSGVIKKIMVKTHPDMIQDRSTIQHTTVLRLLEEEENLDVYWPESRIT